MTERFFNNAGPTDPRKHYSIDPLRRIDVNQVESLIAAERYFILHAPRQTGKTTCLLALMRHLNAAAQYTALYANIEAAQAARSDVAAGMVAVTGAIASAADLFLGDHRLSEHRRQALETDGPLRALNGMLAAWCRDSARPVVLMLDEVDALVGETLISLLRQFREGYANRPAAFPQSVILCGVRDVRDYRLRTASGEIITGGSAFNVKAESLRLGDFSEAEVRELLLQHTEETGQRWTDEAIREIWRLTMGQPWLVNALAYELTQRGPESRDRSRVLELDLVTEAREKLILRRDVHIDQLADKLSEPRVRRVVEPILRSETPSEWATEDDIQYVVDLGLVRRTSSGVEIANPIYREVLPRFLTNVAEQYLASLVPMSPFVAPDGRLLVSKLLEAFQQFFRENSESWVPRFEYKEAGPQLLLQAFLQRIVNGGGRVEREYGLGRMRTDLMVVWKHPGGEQRVVIEAKVVRGARDPVIAQGIVQTKQYMDRCGTKDGHLILFDARPDVTWEERIFREERDGITIWGM